MLQYTLYFVLIYYILLFIKRKYDFLPWNCALSIFSNIANWRDEHVKWKVLNSDEVIQLLACFILILRYTDQVSPSCVWSILCSPVLELLAGWPWARAPLCCTRQDNVTSQTLSRARAAGRLWTWSGSAGAFSWDFHHPIIYHSPLPADPDWPWRRIYRHL